MNSRLLVGMVNVFKVPVFDVSMSCIIRCPNKKTPFKRTLPYTQQKKLDVMLTSVFTNNKLEEYNI